LISTTSNYSSTVGQNYDGQWNVTTRYAYDAAGNQILVTDTLGYVTRSWYDVMGRLISITVNYSSTVAQNYDDQWNVTTYHGYDPVGNQTRVTDTLDHVTLTEYDALNRPIVVTVNYTTAQRADTNVTTTYGYTDVWVCQEGNRPRTLKS
jgi:YD repeat-containing protein